MKIILESIKKEKDIKAIDERISQSKIWESFSFELTSEFLIEINFGKIVEYKKEELLRVIEFLMDIERNSETAMERDQ